MEISNINKQIRREVLLSEKLRAMLLSIVSVTAIFILLIIRISFRQDLEKHFIHTEYIYIIQLIFVLFTIREIIVIKYIKKKLEAEEDVKDRIRFITNFFEVSIPSIILVSIGFFLETTDVLISPVIFLYFIIIILSTLSLDIKISVSIGIIAAVEYMLIFFILRDQFPDNNLSTINQSVIFHLGKSSMLIVAGVISGLVAEQIKKKMLRVNKTVIERNKIVNMFGQQISSSIVDYLLQNDNEIKSENKYVCIMFLDIRGFTHFAESRKPEEIIQYQNNVFGFMIEIINKNHGVINQFLGDGYMATFGAPISTGNDCQNAVNASLQIIDELEKRNLEKQFPNTKIGIGLHGGYVVAGNVGTDIRKQYSISGNTVILASRIEQLNKIYNSQLLISKEVMNKIEKIENIYHGEVVVKGREKPIEIYQLI